MPPSSPKLTELSKQVDELNKIKNPLGKKSKLNLLKMKHQVDGLYKIKTPAIKVEVKECGEPLVHLDILKDHMIFFNLVQYEGGLDLEKTMYLRQSVVTKLIAAQKYLDDKYPDLDLHLRIRSAFRSDKDTKALIQEHTRRYNSRPELHIIPLDEYLKKMLATGEGVNIPPHMTGGAVDINLCDREGKVIDLEIGEGKEGFIPRDLQYPTYSPDLGRIRPDLIERRKIFLEAMEKQDFVNNPDEYWHFSYGDAYWAIMRNNGVSIYGVPDTSKLFGKEDNDAKK